MTQRARKGSVLLRSTNNTKGAKHRDSWFYPKRALREIDDVRKRHTPVCKSDGRRPGRTLRACT